MTKEQREAYRPALEAWLDGELEFAKDGKNFERWDSGYPPVCNYPAEHYRRKPKPRVGYSWATPKTRWYSSKEEVLKHENMPEGAVVVRIEEVLE